MKKYLMIGFAALAFAACSNNDDAFDANRSIVEDTYNAAFVKYVGGNISPNQTWGFGANATRSAVTRSITVNGDVYDKFPSADEINTNFPGSIPEGADEVSQLENLYTGTTAQDQWGNTQTLWGLYQIYAYKIVEGYNLKVTSEGTYENGVVELGGSYQNVSGNIAQPYNVYVDIDGTITLKRNGSTHFNLYVLRGTVNLESDYGEQAGLISVAAGATVNDARNSVAANQGVKIFNRGTFNATNAEKYDIGNFCTFYNEGKFTATGALTYSPGQANTSYFMNMGDNAEVTAPQMTLNSAGNFFNSGKTTIAGETNVTQKEIYWVNAGHYTTGTLTFSAQNATFYNYCQLIVTGNAKMYDGEFNLMQNGYMEAGSAAMDNFIVNIASNTGLHIKGGVRVIAQGDGNFQGFRSAGTNNYLLIDGKVTIDSHKNSFIVDEGITYSINQIEILRSGQVVTHEQLIDEQSGDYPVYVLNGIECPYGDLTVDPGNYNSCGANWSRRGGNDDEIRIIAEDLSASDATDFDFNDVVFDVKFTSETTATVTLKAAGGTLPLTVDGHEVHKAFGIDDEKTMINTNAGRILTPELIAQGYKAADGLTAQPFTVTGINKANWGSDIVVKVKKGGEWYEIKAVTGGPTAKICVRTNFTWPNEKQSIKSLYERFQQWVTNPSVMWYD